MSGIAITVFDKGDIDFGSPAAGAVMGDMPIAENVDISQFTQVVALVRLHTNQMASSGSPTLTLKFKSVLPSPEDPAVFFRESSFLAPTVPIAKADLNGRLYRVSLGADLGAMVSVFVTGTQGGSVAALKATISVVFSMKE